ncbi:hypothetical protein GCM10027589_41870 [Actinocorallia lasiicapitis]
MLHLVMAVALALSPATGARAAEENPLTVTVREPGIAPGLLFIGEKGERTPHTVRIVNDEGRSVWSQELPPEEEAFDFRQQTYQGKPVLTWWQGGYNGNGWGTGIGVIAGLDHHIIATVHAEEGTRLDGHEFLLTPEGTALVITYPEHRADMTSIGGPADGRLVDGVVHEIDVATGKTLMKWSALDHATIADSYGWISPNTTGAYDFAHINSVGLDTDGDLLISMRNLSSVFKVDRHTGAVKWRLGGKRNDFTFGPGASFNYQHDARATAPGIVHVFDNENAYPETTAESVAKWLKVDPVAKTVELVREIRHPAPIAAAYAGNVQELPNGNTLISWGHKGRISEFDPTGKLLFDAALGAGYNTYRTYRMPVAGL